MPAAYELTLLRGDMLERVRELPDDHFDAVITDPPYHLASIVKRFGGAGAAPARASAEGTGAFERASRGFMGKEWDGGDIAFRSETWAEVLRVLKPGAHLAAFAATKNYHHLAMAVELAGFEVRDMLAWIYGSGFPKSHDIGKAARRNGSDDAGSQFCEGFGTALKPAHEPIVLARKPLVANSIVDQVGATGTGALNIDACRLESLGKDQGKVTTAGRTSVNTYGPRRRVPYDRTKGRHPANLMHDGSPEASSVFPADGSGSAARFFYEAKADNRQRRGSAHPTVKPVDLMCWLVRLLTREGGLILDPFAGTGTTGWAASIEGRWAVMIEREEEHQRTIQELIDNRPRAPRTRRRRVSTGRER